MVLGPGIAGAIRRLGDALRGRDATAPVGIPDWKGLPPLTRGPRGPETLLSPATGATIALEEVGDSLFSSGALGRGCAVRPEERLVVSPVTGMITALAPTRHAIEVVSDLGCEVLVHVGVDTQRLGGRPFSPRVQVGERVTAAQPLMDVDLAMVAAAGLDDSVILIVTNSAEYGFVETLVGHHVHAGDELLRLGMPRESR